jgi:hypothetical protein
MGLCISQFKRGRWRNTILEYMKENPGLTFVQTCCSAPKSIVYSQAVGKWRDAVLSFMKKNRSVSFANACYATFDAAASDYAGSDVIIVDDDDETSGSGSGSGGGGGGGEGGSYSGGVGNDGTSRVMAPPSNAMEEDFQLAQAVQNSIYDMKD